MPRQRGYEYPQVHRPVRPDLALVPPQLPQEPRFSWVETPTDEHDSKALQQLDAANAAPQQSEPTIQPLPTVPNHISAAIEQQSKDQSIYQTHPNDRREVADDYNIPVQYQAQFASSAGPQSPIPHYTQQTNISVPLAQQQAALEKPPIPPLGETEKPQSDAQVQRPNHITIAPDQNPLAPHSPHVTTPSSPNFRNNPPPHPISFPLVPPAASQKTPASTGDSWHHGLCSCADPTICVTGLFCPCILYGRIQYRLNLKYQKQDATNMLGYSAINGGCISWAVLCGANILLTAVQRTRIRKRYEMNGEAGNFCEDCVKSICCCCCVLAQNEKEIQWREEERRGQRSEGYIPPPGMSYISGSAV